MASRDEIVAFLDTELNVGAIEDESINGLQVEGMAEVTRVGLVTDAAIATSRKARDQGCQMIVAHHGILWKGQMKPVTGALKSHLKMLFDAGINLYGVHLPLDLHPTLGNNAELCRMIGAQDRQPFATYHGTAVGFSGTLARPMAVGELAAAFEKQIGGQPVVMDFGPDQIRTVGIVSGGGGFALDEAIAGSLDCFVTGEGSHHHHHLALENEMSVIYLGHYHSETPGPKAVGAALERHFDVETVFIDEPTII